MGPLLMVHLNVVGLDFDKLGDEFDDVLEEGWAEVSERIEKVWEEKATQQLHTTRDEYMRGLSIEHLGGDLIQATLTGFLPVSLEEGRERYDMKEGMLGSGISRVIPIGKGRGGAINFRTMKTDGDGWWHPGFQAKQIHKQVEQEVSETIVPEVFGRLISRMTI